MNIYHSFDSGVLSPHEETDTGLLFKLVPSQGILNVLLTDAPDTLTVDLLVEEKGRKFIERQGLLVSYDGVDFKAVPLTVIADDRLQAAVTTQDGSVRLATRYPYGRDSLEKLICETAGAEVRWSFLQKGHRGLPIAEWGTDTGDCPVHYFIAGEDAWETAGIWTADAIVRALADPGFTKPDKCLIRVIPVVSPHSTTTDKGSYETIEGKGIYGAAAWADTPPPAEYRIVRDLVVETIKQQRLGYMMTIHSWQAQRENSGLETIRAAGDNALSQDRADRAEQTMQAMLADLPHGVSCLADSIWHPGLARDYLLAEYNAVTFRVEITTANSGMDEFRKAGEAFLANLNIIDDWSFVC